MFHIRRLFRHSPHSDTKEKTMIFVGTLSLLLPLLVVVTNVVTGFSPISSLSYGHTRPAVHPASWKTADKSRRFLSYADDDGAPSDYDTEDISSGATDPQQKTAVVDDNEEDALIRDELKRELLLLASVTNRGEYASVEERNIVIDLVTQLEALNPTAEPAKHCDGEWDLCLTSTQSFRSSPFFQSIRVAVGDDNKAIAENGFDLHDRATAGSRIGRVRQRITSNQLVSEVDLEVGVAPGIPIKVKGTVMTSARMDIVSSDRYELRVQGTRVKGSNIPLFNQFLDDLNLELPVGEFYRTLQGQEPIVPMRVRCLNQKLLRVL